MSATWTLARKEFSALGGAWLVIAAAILAGELPPHDLRKFEIVVYIAGCATLGALSIGHEYRYRTLPQLLALPVPRTRLFAVKTAILAVFILALAAVVYAVAFSGAFYPAQWDGGRRGEYRTLLVLPIVYGLFVAPWLALKTRNTLAAALFACSLAALLYIAGDRIGTARSVVPIDIAETRIAVTWMGSWLLCAAAAVALWRSVQRWQAVEDVRADIALPAILRLTHSTGLVRSNRFLLLAGKELRLQQLTFVVSLLYALLYIAVWLDRAALLRPEDLLMVATVTHAIIVAALAGAFACGEERVLGTLEWQLLQPVSARVQFAIKGVTAAALALLLTLAVPAVLSAMLGGAPTWQQARPSSVVMAVISGVAFSMYVCSLATGALTGLLLCIPAFLLTLMFVQSIIGSLVRWTILAFHPLRSGPLAYSPYVGGRVDRMLWGALVWIVLAFAFENYRQADRPLRRPALQLLGLAALVTIVSAAFAAAGRVF